MDVSNVLIAFFYDISKNTGSVPEKMHGFNNARPSTNVIEVPKKMH